MKSLFRNIMQIEEVHGVLFLKPDGTIAYSEFSETPPGDIRNLDWPSLLSSLSGHKEVELVFENARFFLRRTETGIIVVMSGHYALSAMIRLNCDILDHSLGIPAEKPKGLRRFFGRS
jgi:hypothetical protein